MKLKSVEALRALYDAAHKELDTSCTHDGITNCKKLVDARLVIDELEAREIEDADDIILHAARAYFACAWADYQERKPDGVFLGGCEIMDVMPDEVPEEAVTAAKLMIKQVEDANGMTIKRIFQLAQLLPYDYADRECNEEMFGHYLAMQAMGHGVGLESVCDRDVLDLKDVYYEFSYFDLDPDDYPDLDEEE